MSITSGAAANADDRDRGASQANLAGDAAEDDAEQTKECGGTRRACLFGAGGQYVTNM